MSTTSIACHPASRTVPIQARSKAIKSVATNHSSPSLLAGKANLTEGPTPSKSPLADADDADCIPDTPDEGSASKAVHASLHAAGACDHAAAGVQSTEHAKGMADPAVLPRGPTTAVASPASHVAVSRARRMVPESPDEEGPPHVIPHGEASSQLPLHMHMTHQEAAAAAAPPVQQLPSQSLSHSLHLSLGLHSSGEASYQPANQSAVQAQHQAEPQEQLPAQPVIQAIIGPHQGSAVTAHTAASAADHGDTSRQAVAMPLSVEAGAAKHSSRQSVAATGTSQPSYVHTNAPVRPSAAEPPAVASATSCLAGTAAGVQAPPAVAAAVMTDTEAEAAVAPAVAAAAMTDIEAKAAAVMPAVAAAAMTDNEAEAAAVTPAGSRHAHTAQVASSAGMHTGSPMNDSALMAALDSAERKVMQVPKDAVSVVFSHLTNDGC